VAGTSKKQRLLDDLGIGFAELTALIRSWCEGPTTDAPGGGFRIARSHDVAASVDARISREGNLVVAFSDSGCRADSTAFSREAVASRERRIAHSTLLCSAPVRGEDRGNALRLSRSTVQNKT
jgi:hypothetical protein